MRNLIALILGSCLLASCCHRQSEMCGSISEGRYFDPQGLFSVDVPSSEFCRIGESENVPSCSGVIFFENQGQLKRVESLQLPDQDFMSIALEITKEERNNLLMDLFQDRILPLMLSKAELKATITADELVSLGEESGYFAVISISNGQTEVQEGFLSCFIGDQYVLFSERTSDGDKEQFLNDLIQLYQSYKNENLESAKQV